MGAAEDYFLDPNATLGDSLHIKCLLTHRAYVIFLLALRCLFKLLYQKIRLLGNDSLSPGFFAHEQITTFTPNLNLIKLFSTPGRDDLSTSMKTVDCLHSLAPPIFKISLLRPLVVAKLSDC